MMSLVSDTSNVPNRVSPSKPPLIPSHSSFNASTSNNHHDQHLIKQHPISSNGGNSSGSSITGINGDNKRQEIAELSPDERFIRFHDVITNTKNVQLSYKAFDTTNGVEIAWHKISLDKFHEKDYQKFISCINIVNALCCENIVVYQATWFSNYNNNQNDVISSLAMNKSADQNDIITEGQRNIDSNHHSHESVGKHQYLNIITTHLESLAEFIGKVKTLKWKIIKKWCRHVLQGLQVLHCQVHPLVHCNLSCSHIYIDGTSGKITIGDIWLSTVLGISHPVNSPFRASEINGDLLPTDPKVDIYSFGITVLEMISRESSSASSLSCNTMENNRDKAIFIDNESCSDFSDILQRIKNDQAVDFIKLCFLPVHERPTASELLSNEFLTSDKFNDDQVILTALPKVKSRGDLMNSALSSNTSKDSLITEILTRAPSLSSESLASKVTRDSSLQDINSVKSCTSTKLNDNAREKDLSQLVKLICISRVADNADEIFMQINISASLFADGSTSTDKEVEFTYDSANENIETVIIEMVEELGLQISVEELTLLVGSYVTSFFLSSVKICENAVSVDETRINGGNVSWTNNGPMTAVSTQGLPISRQSSGESSEIGLNIDQSPSSTPSKTASLIDSAVVSPSVAVSPSQAKSPAKSLSATLDNSITVISPACISSLESAVVSHNTAEENPSSKSNEVTPTNSEKLVSTDASSSTEINPANFADDLILQKILEKNDQEARAARRAFETRIQKLMSIQEKCREDLQKLKNDLQTKMQDFAKREESAISRKNQDVQKINSEFDSGVKNLRSKLRHDSPSS